MKTLRLLFVTALWITLCTGLSSCGKDYLDKSPEETVDMGGSNDLEDTYSKYINDYENITCQSFGNYGNDTITFTGLTAKGYLIINLFQKDTKTKVFDWVDNIKTDTIYEVHNGYGEYEEVKINSIKMPFIQFHSKQNKDFIAMLHFNGSQVLKRALFVNGVHSKITDCLPNWMQTFIPNWYNNKTCFIHDCCYTFTGDTIYTIKYGEYEKNINEYGSRIATNGYGSFQYQFEQISSEEAIGAGIDIDTFNSSYALRIARINYRTSQNVWGGQRHINLPFDYEANAKLSYSLANKSSDIWECKVNITYYSGTKKDYTFSINIETGTIIGEELPISYASLKGTWDMTKCYGWEYNGAGVKEDWTEDVTGEYIFFESTHGNGGYFDGSKIHYFASSLDGNKLILKNSNWLLGKSITITKLTTTELHITATEASSVENYEMKKR